MDIILSTINARYSHTSFGLRYLYANLPANLQSMAEIVEFNLGEAIDVIAEKLLNKSPKIIGLGVYIWNIAEVTELVGIIKSVSPATKVIIGGPEVSYEQAGDKLCELADYIISGEGEEKLPLVINSILSANEAEIDKIQIGGEIKNVEGLNMPYDLYSDADIANRLIYVEASRGCPYSCEFCVSSLSCGVRDFALDEFLSQMAKLIERGVRHFKFVDRTFNLKYERAAKIVDFFLNNHKDGMMLHFEIFPDKLTDKMLALIAKCPPEFLHLEAGVQSFNLDALTAISRKQDEQKTLDNLRFIREQTGALVHADLVAGLPYEDLASFAVSFDKLFSSRPHEIQLGILKRLKGTPISRHTDDCAMVYAKDAPYEILQNKFITFADMQRLKRFARYYDIFINAGNFNNTTADLFPSGQSAFACFMSFSDYLWGRTERTHKISIENQAELLFSYLQDKVDINKLRENIRKDYYTDIGRKSRLKFLE